MKKLRERIKKYKLIKADISNIDLQLQELKENIYGLTEREMEILALMVEGLSNPQIAERCIITKSTAKAHVHSILQKLCVSKRTKAVTLALEKGLV